MGANSKQKGNRYERQIAAELTAFGLEAKRALNETRDGNTGDIVFSGAVPLVVGARHRKDVSVWEAVRDIERAARGSGKLPIAFIKRTAFRTFPGQEVAAMPKEAFYVLLRLALDRLLQPDSTIAVNGPPEPSGSQTTTHPDREEP